MTFAVVTHKKEIIFEMKSDKFKIHFSKLYKRYIDNLLFLKLKNRHFWYIYFKFS